MAEITNPGTFQQYMGGNNGRLGTAVADFDAAIANSPWDDWSKETRGNFMNLMQQDYQNAYNAWQSEMDYRRQIEMIDKQNEYNSPANQMARFQAAGLNPAVIYGQISAGNQSQIPKYDVQRSAEAHMEGDPRGTREQKWQMALDGLGVFSGLFKQAMDMYSQYQGVRHQSLENDILEANLPFEKEVASYRHRYFTSDLQYYKRGVDAVGNPTMTVTAFPQDITNIAFPKLNASTLAGSKDAYQKWWNEQIAPLYRDITRGKSVQAQSMGDITKYNEEMLSSLPPVLRSVLGLILSFAKLF